MITTTRTSKRIVRWLATTLLPSWLFLASAGAQPLDAHYESARAAVARGDAANAKRELKLSIQSNPLHADSHFLLASLLAQEGDLDQAVVGFQQTLKLEPSNALARYNLATAMLWRGEPLPAARLLEEVVSIRPDYIPAYNNLAKAYFLTGIPALAVATYQEALRQDPANSVARENLALLTGAAELPRTPGPGGLRKPAAAPDAPRQPSAPSPTVPPGSLGERLANAAQGPPLSPAEREARDQADAEALQAMLRDLPHVKAERRGDRLILAGWTSDEQQRKVLDRIIASRPEVVDLTTSDMGDPHRLIEVDAILFKILGMDSQSVGHNFLERIQVNASVADGALSTLGSFGWMYEAIINYEVNIANVAEQRIALLARPHLTTLSGTPARFLAGGDIVFKVAGTTSGDIKPYPFGTTLEVTPTLLRTQGDDGSPRVRLAVKAGRKTILPVDSPEVSASEKSVVFDDVNVTSEAVLALDQTLILTGLNQRERRVGRSGVPGLKSIPLVKYLFSSETTTTSDLAIVILLTPRDPAFRDEKNQEALAEFVEKRRAYIAAAEGTEEDMRRFKERYPDWYKLAPNRFASHFFLMENSEVYRRVSGMDLANEALNFDLLGKMPKKKGKQ